MIYNIIENNERISVSEIEKIAGMEQAIVSQNLAMLRKAKIIYSKKENKKVFYSVNKEKAKRIVKLCREIVEKNDKGQELNKNYSLIDEATQILKTISNATRMTLMETINKKGQQSQNQLIIETHFQQSVISQNLTLLEKTNIIYKIKTKEEIVYNLNYKKLETIINAANKIEE